MKMNMKMKSEKYILKMTTFGLQKDRIKKNKKKTLNLRTSVDTLIMSIYNALKYLSKP